MNFLVIPDSEDKDAVALANAAIDTLVRKGNRVYILPEMKGLFLRSDAAVLAGICSGYLHAALITGSDRIVFRYIDMIYNLEIPVFGIYCESPGFFTECAPDMADMCINAILSGKIQTGNRMVIWGEIDYHDKTIEYFTCVNEMILYGSPMNGILSVRIGLNFDELDSFSADSVIIATPTGSAAHNFLAGGPVLMPELDCFLIHPVCARTSVNRPVILDGGETITLEIRAGTQRASFMKPYMVLDGMKMIPLEKSDTIIIRKAAKPLQVFSFDKKMFYRLVQKRVI